MRRLVLAALVGSVRGFAGGAIRRCGVEVRASVDEEGARAVRGSGKVPVELGNYDDLSVRVPRVTYDEAACEAKFQQVNKPYVLTPVRVAEEGGAQLGRVVVTDAAVGDWKKKDWLIELVLDQKEPWGLISAKLQGMGQMEFKSFDVDIPEGLEEHPAGRARCEILVKNIYHKGPDPRSDDEKRRLVAAKLQDKARRENNERLDAAIRADLASRSKVDSDKVVKSVSWAKFGPKSTADLEWALITEEIADKEGIDFNDVPAFLRTKAKVTWLDH